MIQAILIGLGIVFGLGVAIIGWIKINQFLSLLMSGDVFTIVTAIVIVLAVFLLIKIYNRWFK